MSAKASRRPGKWRNELAPYLVEIMDVCGPAHPAQEVYICKFAQGGYTEAIVNAIFAHIDMAPGPMLLLLPVEDLAKAISNQKIGPSIDASPRLKKIIAAQQGRSEWCSTTLEKKFLNGMLRIAGANSGAIFRGLAYKLVVLDDADALARDVDGEGEPVELARNRVKTFGSYGKLICCSSPTGSSKSRVGPGYEGSDQRLYHVPCPHCHGEQALVWERLDYKNDIENPVYNCVHCGVGIEHRYKTWMLRHGRWIAHHPERSVVGFQMNELYSPFETWANLARLWVAAQGDPGKLKTFINTRLGEVWREQGEAPEWERLLERRDMQRFRLNDGDTLPHGVLAITAGADVQADRLEIEIVGWGVGLENWQLNYLVLPGNPALPQVWADLDEVLERIYKTTVGGDMAINLAMIDAGYMQDEVVHFAAGRSYVRATKGATSYSAPILSLPSKVDVTVSGRKRRRGGELTLIGSAQLTGLVYRYLQLPRQMEGSDRPPPGYCHFPADADEAYFKMLTAEQLVTIKGRKGVDKPEWQKIRERNEALDCRKNALAAVHALGLARLRPDRWQAWYEEVYGEPLEQLDLGATWDRRPSLPQSKPPSAAKSPKEQAAAMAEQVRQQRARLAEQRARNEGA